MPFIGVRISWLMFARNSLFKPLAFQRGLLRKHVGFSSGACLVSRTLGSACFAAYMLRTYDMAVITVLAGPSVQQNARTRKKPTVLAEKARAEKPNGLKSEFSANMSMKSAHR